MDSKFLLSTHPSFLLERLISQYKKQDRLIIAYDFDDTVCPMYSANCEDVKSIIRKLKSSINAFFIVFTSNKDIDSIKEYLDEEEIPYNAINENAEFVPFKEGKIFYNVLLDDKAGLGETVNTLRQLIYLVENKHIQKEKAL